MRLLLSRHLENFLALYEARNMHNAAERKGISQPALTKSLKLLEQDLNAELFIRTHRGLEPTEAGDLLYRHAFAIDQEARFASFSIGEIHDRLGGRIRIGIGPVVAVSIFPAVLAEFHRQLPSVRISVETAISTHLVDGVLNSDFDVVVGAMPEIDLPERLHTTKLLTTDMVVVCRKDHPLGTLGRVDRDALKSYGRIGFVDDTDWEKKIGRVFDVSPQTLLPMIETTSLSVIFAMLHTTDYYAIVSEMIIPRAVQDGLVAFTPEGGLWTLDIDLTCKKSLANSRPITLLRRALERAK